jgi:hypothetical protein
MSRSARSSIDCGVTMPSALAAFRLIARSNFGVRSECDRQLLATAAAKLVAEHRGEILELLNRP